MDRFIAVYTCLIRVLVSALSCVPPFEDKFKASRDFCGTALSCGGVVVGIILFDIKYHAPLLYGVLYRQAVVPVTVAVNQASFMIRIPTRKLSTMTIRSFKFASCFSTASV